MRSCVVLLFASLLTLCEAQGTIVTPVFVLKGRDLLLKLHADPPEGVSYVDWKINKTVTLLRIVQSTKSEVYGSFTGRVEFEKFSVILKNVQEVDSGVYSAVAGTDAGDKLVSEYKVTVQGPVSPVELIVGRVDSSSSESCDLHVTCRTHAHISSSTFRCVDRVCSQEGGERSQVTTSGASLQVYLLNNVIICNHSNQVHRTQDLIPAEQLCYPSTGTIVTPVFVLKGRDLLLKLHADPPEGVLCVDWKINKTVDLVRFKPSGEETVLRNSTGGFEFPENKFSVTLKNVQEVDSGVYSAEVRTLQGNKLLTEYEVTVQGPVSPVVLIVDRVDSSSSESCDLHVTCRTHNSNISSTFRCSKRVCSQEGGERLEVTTSGASLQVHLLNNLIICNHNNKVHRTHDFKTTEHLCDVHADPPSHLVWVIASCTAALTLILIVVLSVWLYNDRRRRIGSRRSVDNVIYEAAQDETSAPQNPTNDVTYSSDETSAPQNPTNDVTYSSVKFHARSPQAAAATGRNQSESLYAEVKKPGRSFND
ncbi:uncharacterized protein LOC120815120 [Gasterosteus aculeatus]